MVVVAIFPERLQGDLVERITNAMGEPTPIAADGMAAIAGPA